MNTETEIILRTTVTGRCSDGDSDIQAQTQLIDTGYHITDVKISGDDFTIVGLRPFSAAASYDRLRERVAVLEEQVGGLEQAVDFYSLRVSQLQKLLAKMPEPWITLCADIVANGYPRDWGVGEFLRGKETTAEQLEASESLHPDILSDYSIEEKKEFLREWGEDLAS